jgi:serine/threonine protein phosphatase PrpC
VRDSLKSMPPTEQDTMKVARGLIDKSLEIGIASDNISVVIVALNRGIKEDKIID